MSEGIDLPKSVGEFAVEEMARLKERLARYEDADGNPIAAPSCVMPGGLNFSLGDSVKKKSGSEWSGNVVGWYSTILTQEGYAVESDSHAGSVQIYPASALIAAPAPGNQQGGE